MNVAISRAKRHLVVICDTVTCSSDEYIKNLLLYITEQGDIRYGSEFVDNESWFDDITLTFDPNLSPTHVSQRDSTAVLGYDQGSNRKEANSKVLAVNPVTLDNSVAKVKKQVNISENNGNIVRTRFVSSLHQVLQDVIVGNDVATSLLKDINAQLVVSPDNSLAIEFSRDLNKHYRRLVHEKCESINLLSVRADRKDSSDDRGRNSDIASGDIIRVKYKLLHESRGEGKYRQIVVKQSLNFTDKKDISHEGDEGVKTSDEGGKTSDDAEVEIASTVKVFSSGEEDTDITNYSNKYTVKDMNDEIYLKSLEEEPNNSKTSSSICDHHSSSDKSISNVSDTSIISQSRVDETSDCATVRSSNTSTTINQREYTSKQASTSKKINKSSKQNTTKPSKTDVDEDTLLLQEILSNQEYLKSQQYRVAATAIPNYDKIKAKQNLSLKISNSIQSRKAKPKK